MEQKKKVKFGKWWREARPTKTTVFWLLVGSVVLTMILGFVWGGWVTGRTSRVMAQDVASDAVVERLAAVCVSEFNLDPGKAAKLGELKEASRYQRDEYVTDQGWATISGEERPDRKVVDECVRLLMLINP